MKIRTLIWEGMEINKKGEIKLADKVDRKSQKDL